VNGGSIEGDRVMKRSGCLVLVFVALVLVAAGCRRSASDRKREPVAVVNLSDVVEPPKIQDMAIKLRKKEKAAAAPEETDAERKVREAKAEQKMIDQEKAEKQQRLELLVLIARACRAFVSTTPPPKVDFDNFRLYLRRKRLEDERSALDGKRIDVVMDAEFDAPQHIVAYRTDAENGIQQAVYTNETIANLKQDDLPRLLRKQELESLYKKFVGYARQTQQRSLAGFTQYLQEAAPPSLLRPVKDGTVLVNPLAMPNNPGDLVAYQSKLERDEVQVAVVKGHLSVMGNGEVRYMLPDAVQKAIPKQ
jgi:hypothetical protein